MELALANNRKQEKNILTYWLCETRKNYLFTHLSSRNRAASTSVFMSFNYRRVLRYSRTDKSLWATAAAGWWTVKWAVALGRTIKTSIQILKFLLALYQQISQGSNFSPSPTVQSTPMLTRQFAFAWSRHFFTQFLFFWPSPLCLTGGHHSILTMQLCYGV